MTIKISNIMKGIKMDIKKRLIIYNNLTIIVPLMVTGIVALIFIFVSSKFFNTNITYNDFKKVSIVKSELLNVTNDIAKSGTKSIKGDREFQKYLTEKLSAVNGKIIIIKNGNVEFSSQDLEKIDIAKSLRESDRKLKNHLQIDNIYYSIDRFPLIFRDGTPGKVIFLVPSAVRSNILKNFIITILLTFLISFASMSVIISYIFSKKILEPITLLKKATAEISRGDLNFRIVESGDREVRELCADFEKMRIQLRDSVRMRMKYDENRKMLLSSISHDLKTPITSIEGYVQGILDGVASTPQKLEHYLKTIYSKAGQMNSMIDDLLLYSKLDLKQIPFNYEKTDIVEYFNYYISENEPELEKSNIKIKLENDLKNSKYVMIDRERFMRVILNIIGNSKKYMDKTRGQITIFLRETNLSIIIEIRDNGCGISQNNANKIFNRFYREDPSRNSIDGSGLGLAISKQIVEGHNGKIWAISHGTDGTSIIISLGKIANTMDKRGNYEKNFNN